MKAHSIKVLEFLQEHENEEVTTLEVAEALGMEKRFVDAIFSSAIVGKGLGTREKKDEKHLLKLNAKGKAHKQEKKEEEE